MTHLTLRALRFSTVALSSLLLSVVPVVAAQDAGTSTRSTADSELIISKGTFEKDGKRVPATLRNVVDLVAARYSRANVTIVGADAIVLEDLALRWPRPYVDSKQTIEPSLLGLFAALRAASQNRFRVEHFSDYDFVLSADGHYNRGPTAEVFNLGPLLSNHRTRQLERQLREAETELTAVRKVRGQEHGDVAGIKIQIELLKAHLSEAGPSPESAKIIGQIETAVKLTLAQLSSREKMPEFSYHPGTNLLIIVGGDEAIQVTRKVVAALEKGAN